MDVQIDVAELWAAASRFDGAADSLDRVARPRMTFGASSAGRAHTVRGDAVRAALDGVHHDLSAWSRANAEIAAQLRMSAARYTEAESRAAAGLA